MLKILNVERIIGLHCNGNPVKGVMYSVKENAYIFEFNIPRIKPEPVEVYFREGPYENEYEIFVMGFHIPTVLSITKEEVMGKNASEFASLLRNSLQRLEQFHNQNSLPF